MKDNSEISFLVKSDSGLDPYTVVVIIENDRMIVSCNCPAGKFGKFCKHKIRLIQEDLDILYDDSQCDELSQVGDWIQHSDFLDLIFDRSKFKKELREAQERLEAVKKKMRPIEDKMARAMKNGINAIR